ncbi:halocarboxylic acid dehydrogenase DehI family protein [Salinisphaera aquimarina]|uniref:Halocarboxylic acid dehydrogenase DehI family protein n=1 Tax=Salinisphaera aquimarina TaxID=2094031 RepID=A0ABV7ER43_9GAMM
MERVPQLPDVTMDKAGAELRPLYQDVEQTLRVPFVNFIFRMLANFPDYFEPTWRALAPGLRTLEFEQAADRLRAAAVPALYVDTMTGDGLSPVDRQAVVDFTDSIHYVLPKLLLVASCLDLHLSGHTPAQPVARLSPRAVGGVAEGTRLLGFVDPARADASVRRIFDDIRGLHAHPGVASYYRGLGNYPGFLDTAWSAVRTRVTTPAYAAQKQSVITLAQTLAEPFLRDEFASLDASAHNDISAVLAVFRYRIIPDLLLDVALIKSMLDGPEAARRSRFSIA